MAVAASELLCTLALLNPEASSAAALPLADGGGGGGGGDDDDEAAALAAARRRQEQPLPADAEGAEDGAGAGGPTAMVVDGSIAPDNMFAPPPPPTLDDLLDAQPRSVAGNDELVGQLAF